MQISAFFPLETLLCISPEVRLRPLGVLTPHSGSLFSPLSYATPWGGGLLRGIKGIRAPLCDNSVFPQSTLLQIHSNFLCGPPFTPKLFSFLFQPGCSRMLQKQLCRPHNISDKTCPVTFSEPKFIKAVQHKWYFIAECSFYGEHSPFWAGREGVFQSSFFNLQAPYILFIRITSGASLDNQTEMVQHRKSSDNLWEVG